MKAENGSLTELEQVFLNDGYNIASARLRKGASREEINAALGSLYETLDAFLELFVSNAKNAGNAVSCLKGCAWCCHQAVFAQDYEFAFLKDWLFQNIDPSRLEEIRRKAKEKKSHTRGLSPEAMLQHKEACPLLVDNACSAYEARPVACRIYLSRDVGSCEKEFRNPKDSSNIPSLFDLPFKLGRRLNEGFARRLKELDIPIHEAPLEQGLLK